MEERTSGTDSSRRATRLRAARDPDVLKRIQDAEERVRARSEPGPDVMDPEQLDAIIDNLRARGIQSPVADTERSGAH
jgi:hypothetical protein